MPLFNDPARPSVSPSARKASEDNPDDRSEQLSEANGVDTDVSSLAIDRGMLAMGGIGAQPATEVASSPAGSAANFTDAEVMLRVRAGDESAFEYLVQKYRRAMVSFMYRMTHNSAVAEDLAQEVFLRVYRSRAGYEASAKFTTWLYRIATNLAVNHARDTRHERPENQVSLDEPDEETGTTMDVADSSLTVEQTILRRERMDAIRAKVQNLPERQRMAVIMHKYQQMDYKQIAEVLKLSESATKSLLFRAYETLREQLRIFVRGSGIMKCDEIKEMMLDVAAGAGEATSAMNEHLLGCTDCMEKFAGMQQTMALLDEWQAPEPSPYFDTRFAARMREERAKPQRAAWLSWFRAPVLAGALALVLTMVGGVNWFTSRNNGPIGPVSQAAVAAPPGTAVGDLQELEKDEDLYANYDILDDLQAPGQEVDQNQNP